MGAQPATVPSKPASAGMTAPGYATLLTNDPVAQLGALVAYVNTAVAVEGGQ